MKKIFIICFIVMAMVSSSIAGELFGMPASINAIIMEEYIDQSINFENGEKTSKTSFYNGMGLEFKFTPYYSPRGNLDLSYLIMGWSEWKTEEVTCSEEINAKFDYSLSETSDISVSFSMKRDRRDIWNQPLDQNDYDIEDLKDSNHWDWVATAMYKKELTEYSSATIQLTTSEDSLKGTASIFWQPYEDMTVKSSIWELLEEEDRRESGVSFGLIHTIDVGWLPSGTTHEVEATYKDREEIYSDFREVRIVDKLSLPLW